MSDAAGNDSSSVEESFERQADAKPSILDEADRSFSGSGNTSSAKRTRTESTSGGENPQPRRLWVKTRSNEWWDQISSPDFPDEDFKKAFRMSRANFDSICEELEPAVAKKDTTLRLAIPVRQRVAVCIWRLATGEALREVSRRFGLGISTCHKLILEVCTAIKTILMPKFLLWPDENRSSEIKLQFESFSGIPNIVGSIYTTHIPIIAPEINPPAYFNRTYYSITLQAVVGPNGVFTDICIGWPGSMSDEQVLEKSALFKRASKNELKGSWIVGRSSHGPMKNWILVPCSHQNLTWTQHTLNSKVEEVQRVAKDSVMRLKARWSCLRKRTEMNPRDLPVVVGACCVLHNICEMRNEGLSPELGFELFDDETFPKNSSVEWRDAVLARDQIARNLLHQNLAGT